MGELDPVTGRDLGVEPDRRAMGKRKHVWANRDRRQRGRDRSHVVQSAEPAGPGQVDTDLLDRFPGRRLEQIGISGPPPTTGKADLTGPGIICPLGPADEEEGIGVRGEDQGHGSPPAVRVRGFERGAPGQAPCQSGQRRGERVDQWPCEWQDPPQQPPAGGPSWLKSAGLPALAGRAGSDIRRSTFRSRHSGQLTVVPFRTNRSKSVPQEGQW